MVLGAAGGCLWARGGGRLGTFGAGASKVVCAKCGARGRHIDVRPNWKEQPAGASLTGKQWR